MKVLQVNNVYAVESTGKLTMQLHEGLLSRGHESLVVYGRGPDACAPGVIRLCPQWYGKLNSLLSRITGLRYGGCLISTWRLQRIIRREKPDIVHLQCINGNFVNIYRLISWLKKNRIKTVASQHAEFMYTANCGYALECEQWRQGCVKCPDRKRATKSIFFDRTAQSWKKMRAAFRDFGRDCVICPVSDWTAERVGQSDILKELPLQTVYNGVDTAEVFHRRDDAGKALEKVILNVTSWFNAVPGDIKGGWYLVQLAKRMPEVTFLVAGRAEPVGELPENLKLLGRIEDQKALAELYRRASLTILVSRKETFSMPCAESLCCGTPVVGFKAGAPERISLSEYSEFIDHGDLDGLEALVRRWLDAAPDRSRIAREAEKAYSVETMVQRFEQVYRRCLWNSEN